MSSSLLLMEHRHWWSVVSMDPYLYESSPSTDVYIAFIYLLFPNINEQSKNGVQLAIKRK